MIPFVCSRSCLTNLDFFLEVRKRNDEGRAVDVAYMDFSKAFDKVLHGRLSQKIKMYRIHDDWIIWILNYLIHGIQRCGERCDLWSSAGISARTSAVCDIEDLDVNVDGLVSRFADNR